VAAAIVSELQKHEFPAQGSRASLGPLNHLLMPAVAVELAPPSRNALAELASANYQQRVAAIVADVVATQREHLGAQP
jgi:N-acetylmuramoyl-L-alanine amidase